MDRVVLITGVSRGIGAACVEKFVKRGWKVCGVALPDKEFKRCESESVLSISGDITLEEVRKTAVSEAVRRFGRIDLLVNNAAIGLYASASETSPDLFLRLLETNLVAPLALTRLVIPAMRHRRFRHHYKYRFCRSVCRSTLGGGLFIIQIRPPVDNRFAPG